MKDEGNNEDKIIRRETRWSLHIHYRDLKGAANLPSCRSIAFYELTPLAAKPIIQSNKLPKVPYNYKLHGWRYAPHEVLFVACSYSLAISVTPIKVSSSNTLILSPTETFVSYLNISSFSKVISSTLKVLMSL